MSIEIFKNKTTRKEKLSMLTCYDASFARLIAQSQIDVVLVGDSAAMTMHGFQSTLPATLDMMTTHVAAVARGLNGQKFLVADLPFLSYRGSLDQSLENVKALLQAGAHAVKLEGFDGNGGLIQHLTDSGVPVMGHVGLTPQFINQFGGFKIQGREEAAAEKILRDSLALEAAGCFAVVIECVPSELGKAITSKLTIPTIGIGAGPSCDGQVLVLQDLLGLNPEFSPRFVRSYLQGQNLVVEAFNHFVRDVKAGDFPTSKESYS